MSETASMVKRRPLGRGLGALIPEGPPAIPPAERRVPIGEIRPNPRQPRRFFDEDRLTELAESIRHQGILQPLVVRRVEHGYELIIGERRFRAAQRAGLDRVPVIVKDITDAESLEMALVENIQREELTPIEEALAYQQLMEEFHLTQEEVANRVGKSRPVVTNLLRVLQLPEEIKEEVDRGNLSVGHARTLLALETPEQQIELARKIMRQGLSVRETEKLVARTLEEQTNPRVAREKEKSGDIIRLEEELSDKLATPVLFKMGTKGKGQMIIDFADLDVLDGVLARLRA